jgi:hypothetical protein
MIPVPLAMKLFRTSTMIALGVMCAAFFTWTWIFYYCGEDSGIPLAEQHRRAEAIGAYARDRTASEIITHLGRPQSTETAFKNALLHDFVYPWSPLTSRSGKWIYMTGYSTCEMLTMLDDKCIAVERVHCWH